MEAKAPLTTKVDYWKTETTIATLFSFAAASLITTYHWLSVWRHHTQHTQKGKKPDGRQTNPSGIKEIIPLSGGFVCYYVAVALALASRYYVRR